MIQLLDNKPEGVFKETLGLDFKYIALLINGEPYGYMAYAFTDPGVVTGHSENIRMTPKIFKQLINHDWPLVLDHLRTVGAKTIQTIYESNGESSAWWKYVKALGFGVPRVFMITERVI